MTDVDQLKEYPEGHKGRKSYVYVRSLGKVVAACYVWHTGSGYELLPEYGGPAINSKRTGSLTVMRDMGEYVSPIDGSRIGSRSEHRDHVRRHDVIEVGTERIGSMERPQESGRRAGYDIKRALESAR